jgi:Bacterial mobilisation protein (MobC)
MARRPKGDEGERRTEFFGFQMTPTERRKLEEEAEARGMLLAEFARLRLRLEGAANDNRSHRAAPETVALVGELGRIGNNLNQLAYHANATGQLPEARLIADAIAELKAALGRIV